MQKNLALEALIQMSDTVLDFDALASPGCVVIRLEPDAESVQTIAVIRHLLAEYRKYEQSINGLTLYEGRLDRDGYIRRHPPMIAYGQFSECPHYVPYFYDRVAQSIAEHGHATVLLDATDWTLFPELCGKQKLMLQVRSGRVKCESSDA